MPTFKVYSEAKFDYITSSGTCLPYSDDVFLSVEAFDICEKSKLYQSIFPIELHERFVFEKFFWDFNDVSDLLDYLKRVPVVIELYQIVADCCHGVLLAYFDTTARDFFYPESDYTDIIETRMIIMGRTSEFPGEPPRLNFTTYTVIDELVSCNRYTTSPRTGEGDVEEESDTSDLEIDIDDEEEEEEEETIPPPSPSLHTRPVIGNEGFLQHTINSALRTRTPIPNYRSNVREYVISDIVQHKSRKTNAVPVYKSTKRAPPTKSRLTRPLITANCDKLQNKGTKGINRRGAGGDGERQKENRWRSTVKNPQKKRPVPIHKRPPFKITKPDENLISRKPVYLDEPRCECPARNITPDCISPHGSPRREYSRSPIKLNKSPNTHKKSPTRQNLNRIPHPKSRSLIDSPSTRVVQSPWTSPKVYSKFPPTPDRSPNRKEKQKRPKSQRIHDKYCRHTVTPPILDDIQSPKIRSRIHQSTNKKTPPSKKIMSKQKSNSAKSPPKSKTKAKDSWTSRLNDELKRSESPKFRSAVNNNSLHSNVHR